MVISVEVNAKWVDPDAFQSIKSIYETVGKPPEFNDFECCHAKASEDILAFSLSPDRHKSR